MEKNYCIKREPTGYIYKILINVAIENCKFVTIIVRPNLGLTASGKKVLEALSPFLVAEEYVTEWPGTKLLEGKALLFRYQLNDSVGQILQEIASSFYDWMQPELPEDVCFLRDIGKPWLISISHENDIWLTLTENEYITIEKNNPDLFESLEEEATVP